MWNHLATAPKGVSDRVTSTVALLPPRLGVFRSAEPETVAIVTISHRGVIWVWSWAMLVNGEVGRSFAPIILDGASLGELEYGKEEKSRAEEEHCEWKAWRTRSLELDVYEDSTLIYPEGDLGLTSLRWIKPKR